MMSPICKKYDTLVSPKKKLIAHFILSTQATVTQNGMGPNAALVQAPIEKQVIRTCAAVVWITWKSAVT
jgi:hypothetical protein